MKSQTSSTGQIEILNDSSTCAVTVDDLNALWSTAQTFVADFYATYHNARLDQGSETGTEQEDKDTHNNNIMMYNTLINTYNNTTQ